MKERRFEILGILCIATSFLALISMVGYSSYEDPGISPNVKVENPMGILGVFIAYFFIKFSFGYSSFLLPVLGSVWGWWFFSKREASILSRISGYLLGVMLLISVTLGLFETGKYSSSGIEFNYSGLIGGNLANFLVSFFGMIGSSIILLTSWLVLIRGYFSWSFYGPFDSLTNFIKKRQEDRKLVSVEQASEKEKRLHTLDLMQKIEEKQEQDVIVKENDIETTGHDLIGSGEIDANLEPLEKPSEEIFNATGLASGFSSVPVPEDSLSIRKKILMILKILLLKKKTSMI